MQQQEQHSEITVFYWYASEDQQWRDSLAQYLKPLERDRQISEWHVQKIPPGFPRLRAIERAIDAAGLILLLVSKDFLASEECQRVVQHAMERQKRGETHVVPVILHPCSWETTPFADLQCLPRNRIPVADSANVEAVLHAIAEDLSNTIKGIQPRTRPNEEQPTGTTKVNGPGSPPKRPPLHAGYAFGVDIGRSHIGVYLANQDAKIIDYRMRAPLDTARIGGESSLSSIAQLLVELAKENRVDWHRVRGIGISVPGAPSGHKLISPPLMGNWFKVDIPRYLKHCLTRENGNIPQHIPVHLNNDANMGALAEKRYGMRIDGNNHLGGGERRIDNLIYVKLGTGIGTGLILRGRLYCGSNGTAGEFGHILLEPETSERSRFCESCEKRGCLESLAGERAIIEDARSRAAQFREEGRVSHFPTKKSEELTIDDLIDAANGGEPACFQALEAAGDRLGRAIGGCLINLLNPSLIVLDGSVIRGSSNEHFNKPLFDALYLSALHSSLGAAWGGTEIAIARLGKEAVALGAIASVLEPL